MLKHGNRLFSLLAVGLLLASFSYAQKPTPQASTPGEVLTNADILNMVGAKLGDDVIISKIKTSTSNFDTSIDAILKLKAVGVSDAVIRAMVEAGGAKEAPAKELPPNPNDPRSPHAAGIYWFSMNQSERRMVRLEATSYSSNKTGGMFGAAMTAGLHKAKWKAVLPGSRAALRLNETTPEFWFYFDEKPQGFGQPVALSGQASKPEEFVLAKMEASGKERLLVVGQAGTLGTSTGIRPNDAVPVEVQKIAPGIYKVTARKPLEPGEYCFVPPGGAVGFGYAGGQLFDFGVDRVK